MYRFTALVIGLTIGVGAAFAGAIQIGGTNGLTNSYITSGCSTNVAGQNCVTGSVGTFSELNYDTRLFLSAKEGTAPTVPYAGYTQTAATTGTFVGDQQYDSGVAFSMINDGCVGSPTCSTGTGPNNYWNANSAGTITVPIGVLDVTDVWTVLDNVWGPAGATDTNVIFTFGTSANDTSGDVTVLTVNLTNASNNGASGQIGTSIDCTTVVTANCNTFAMGTLAPTSTINGVTVNTDTLKSLNYNTGVIGKYINSQGILTLDDQDFVFNNPALSSLYLVSVGVQELNGTGQVSQTALSAITVDTAAPEPSTVMLLLAGFGAIGFARLRLRRS